MNSSADYLQKFSEQIDVDGIEAERASAGQKAEILIEQNHDLKQLIQLTAELPAIATQQLCFDEDVVRIGHADEISENEHKKLELLLRAFMPWKKGPFSIFGHQIDAEWRSDLKWKRLAPRIGDLQGMKVADIGCNNGYFMYRVAASSPDLVVGFEPVLRHQLAFEMMQEFARVPELVFEPLGVEHTDLYPGFFDRIFCLGILYHHTDPVGLLRKMRKSLAPGGKLIVDCQTIPGDEPLALCPKSRYARGRGFWFLPTKSCLEHWMLRSGWSKVQVFFHEPLDLDEQRSTDWAPIASLVEGLDPNDSSRTVEGYPAPWRTYLVAE